MSRYDPDVALRYRLRQSGRLPQLPECPCGRRIRGTPREWEGAQLCARCWEETPEGKEERRRVVAERVQLHRARKRREKRKGESVDPKEAS